MTFKIFASSVQNLQNDLQITWLLVILKSDLSLRFINFLFVWKVKMYLKITKDLAESKIMKNCLFENILILNKLKKKLWFKFPLILFKKLRSFNKNFLCKRIMVYGTYFLMIPCTRQ